MPQLDAIESALSAVARGGFALVVDDADRENEGDLIGASALATRASLALMLRHSSGVVCASVSPARARALQLPAMVPEASNRDPFRTAFLVSCDRVGARGGHAMSTGISASDRAATIRALALAPAPADEAGEMCGTAGVGLRAASAEDAGIASAAGAISAGRVASASALAAAAAAEAAGDSAAAADLRDARRGFVADDFSRPGHVFPLQCREGGVLVRGGHTEAAMDLARLARAPGEGGFLCEVVDKESGEMLRLVGGRGGRSGGESSEGGLVGLARELGVPLVSIADLQRFRLRREVLVEREIAVAAGGMAGGASSASGVESRTLRFRSLFYDGQAYEVELRASGDARPPSVCFVFADIVPRPAASAPLPASSADVTVTVRGLPFENTRGKGSSVSLSAYEADGDVAPEALQAGSAAVAALYPVPAGAACLAVRASRFALAAVCDRVCAELAQVVRAALGGAGGAVSTMLLEDAGRPEAELAAEARPAWPSVRLLGVHGMPLPRVWEFGLLCTAE
jgi:3,4-dihydroxy-2-butanone 4-phosphate synthase